MSENHTDPPKPLPGQSVGLAGGAPPPAVAAATVAPIGPTPHTPPSNWMAGSSNRSANLGTIDSVSNGIEHPDSNVGVPPIDPPPGLLNVGETCYLNSVVQVLFHTPAFCEAVLSFEKKPNTRTSESVGTTEQDEDRTRQNAEAILDELKRLFHLLNSTSRRSEDPTELVDMLRDKTREFEFQADGQQDAHEFLRFLLENVATAMDVTKEPLVITDKSHEINSASSKRRPEQTADDYSPRLKKRPRSQSVNGLVKSNPNSVKYPMQEETVIDGSEALPPVSENHTDIPTFRPPSPLISSPKPPLPTNNCTSDSKGATHNGGSAVRQRDTNAVRRIFRGESVTCTRCCECETKSNRPESFLDLSVPVRVGYSLSGLLTSMAAGDMLTGTDKYACEVCNTKTEAERRFLLSKMPRVFTIHLKLFQYTASRAGVKIPVTTPCPFRMRFDEWCTPECAAMAPWYQLTGIIVHTGGYASSGHYKTYSLDTSINQWYLFDDAVVSPVTEQTVEELLLYQPSKSRKTNYICFYTAED